MWRFYMDKQCPKCLGSGFIKTNWEAEPVVFKCDCRNDEVKKKRTVGSVCNSFDKAIANAQDENFKLIWWKKKMQFINKYTPKLLTYNNNFGTMH